jgi:catechol 2,3-dioxygenase-like lactoylglutathione lyase family enzyme
MTTFRSNTELAIQVPDLDQAEDFYTGVLGFPVIARKPDMLEFDTGALRLYVIRDPSVARSYVPSFNVPDLDTAQRHLTAAGCTPVQAGSHGTTVYYQDPFGFVFDIIERR